MKASQPAKMESYDYLRADDFYGSDDEFLNKVGNLGISAKFISITDY